MIAKILIMLIAIESGGNSEAVNASENAVGVLQIRPIMVKEVNRILELNGQDKVYVYNDRWSRRKSIDMATIFLLHQQERYIVKLGVHPTLMQLAQSWNSGGIFNKPSAAYVSKLKEQND